MRSGYACVSESERFNYESLEGETINADGGDGSRRTDGLACWRHVRSCMFNDTLVAHAGALARAFDSLAAELLGVFAS